MTPEAVLLAGNGLLLGILCFLAKQVLTDVRTIRDRVLILWEWYQNNAERRSAEFHGLADRKPMEKR